MQDAHKRVEHLRRDLLVHGLILLVVHSLSTLHVGADRRHNLVSEDAVDETLDVLLIILPLLVAQVLALLVSIHALSKLLPLAFGRRLGPKSRSLPLNLSLSSCQLDVAGKGHVRHHYSDVFRADVLVVVKVIPVIEVNNVITYM